MATRKAATRKPAKKKTKKTKKTTTSDDSMFAGERIAFVGRLEHLRKTDLERVLKAEGAKLEAKPATATLVVHGAIKKKPEGAISEDELRRRLLPSASRAAQMLKSPKGRKRLAALLELNRDEFSSSTDELSEVVLEKLDLAGANLDGADLCGLQFVRCKLGGASLKRAGHIGGASKSDFRGATIIAETVSESKDCDFREATIKATVSYLQKCRFDDATLSKCTITDLEHCNFTNATLEGAVLYYSDFEKCIFEDAQLLKAKLESAEMKACKLRRADFSGAKLKEMTFEECDLRDTVFEGAVLTTTTFVDCDLRGADFTGAKVSNCTFEDSKEDGAIGLKSGSADKGRALSALESAAPTFKKIEIHVTLKKGSKKRECKLYQFNHGNYPPADFQSWLDGEDMGRQSIASSIKVIADLNTGASLDEASLVVKSSKGTKAPALKPKALKEAVLAAWREALG